MAGVENTYQYLTFTSNTTPEEHTWDGKIHAKYFLTNIWKFIVFNELLAGVENTYQYLTFYKQHVEAHSYIQEFR